MLVLVKKLDFRCLYKTYKFFTNLDKETKIWFDMHRHLTVSLRNYVRLFFSIIIPQNILLTSLPWLACITVLYRLDHTIQAVAYLTIKRSLSNFYESELYIVVGRKLRGKGIGNMLMKALAEEAKRANVLQIAANVSDKNLAAINLFKKNGFNIVSRIRDSKTGHASRYLMELYLNV